jgi:5-methylcytosine-specific restriction protein A
MTLPHKPKRPCSHPGCPKLTDGRFCEEHAKEESTNYNHYQRDPAINKRYGSQWRKVRAQYLSAHPLCERCERHGKLTAATEVHHIRPLDNGGTNDFENLMALCKPCHSEISALEGQRWPKRRAIGHP